MTAIVLSLVGVALVGCGTPAPSGEALRAAGPSRVLSGGLLGFNGEALTGAPGTWSDPRFVGAVTVLHPQAIRLFGGTTANWWDWRRGGFVRSRLLPAALRAVSASVHVSLADLAGLTLATGALPVFDLNVVSSTLRDQLAMLRAAQRMGLPVERVELGNELYTAPYRRAFPDGAAYGRLATHWAAALHRAFPGVLVAVSTFGGADAGSGELLAPRTVDWNQSMTTKLHGVNAFSVHAYFGTDLAPGERPSAGLPARRVLDSAADRWARLRLIVDDSPLPVWVTEWNLFDRQVPAYGTWVQTLAVAELGLDLLADPGAAQIDNHALVSSAPFGALFDGTSSLSVPPQGGFAALASAPPPTVPFTLSANGLAMSALLRLVRAGGTLQPLVFTGGQGALVSGGRGGARALLLNLGSRGRLLALPPELSGHLFRQSAANPAKIVNGPHAVSTRYGRAGLTLPMRPYSVTYVQP